MDRRQEGANGSPYYQRFSVMMHSNPLVRGAVPYPITYLIRQFAPLILGPLVSYDIGVVNVHSRMVGHLGTSGLLPGVSMGDVVKKRGLLLSVPLGLSSLFFLLLAEVIASHADLSSTVLPVPWTDIYTSRTMAGGRLSLSNQSVYGPHICIDYGDPYSPLNSPWAPGLYTYRYRILIPEAYPSDILRVELFDPDSINQLGATFNISHTDLAIVLGDPPAEQLSCNVASNGHLQMNPCLINTSELDWLGPQVLTDGTSIDVGIDHINPYWFVRVDENRGTGVAPGSGACGNPGNYNANYNTRTEHKLSYHRQNADGSVEEVHLTQYTGQMGIEAVIHDTDLRWVSPGAAQSLDQPTYVPVDPGETKGFELSISQDLVNIAADPFTGGRYVYLDVTTLYGASENGFDVWAGPPDYTSTVPSDVNARNLHILNDPGAHDAKGVIISALGTLPLNNNHPHVAESPLVYVGPEHTGQSVFVSLYDVDSGAQPPITFYYDSIAESDWSLTFGVLRSPTANHVLL
jgi:hypothetical protein